VLHLLQLFKNDLKKKFNYNVKHVNSIKTVKTINKQTISTTKYNYINTEEQVTEKVLVW